LPNNRHQLAQRRRNPVMERLLHAPLRVQLRVYDGDGALFDRGSAFLRGLFRSEAVLGNLNLTRRVLLLRPHLIGIRFRSGRLGPLEMLARVQEFAYREEEITLAIEFFESQDATLALLRRTLQHRRMVPPLTPRGAALFRRA
jgi:hypothetical protein